MLRNGYPRIYLLGHLSGLSRCDRVDSACQWDQKDVDLAHEFELGRSEMVAEVAEVGNADFIDAEDKDGVFPSLQTLALVVIGGNRIDGDIADGHVNGPPVLAAGGEAL